ncbi:ROK family protein [Alkalibacillus haloalkaliphilus]|uniref:N-acetylmannosamine kinase n=1 Tax=Alkalibacillus haloalkaliphilus TaxID=94136 RepID=A0A511W6B2_9BACI|nr:ROK family protein [Alkalibacillus haloalkaliphilus]GEN46634.1 N-acetylmannosamine kinase [Alkalibacillus haloalkaliphilus]
MFIGVFDIGGTSIKYGVVNENGEVISKFQEPTEAKQGGEYIIEKLIELSHKLIEQWPLDGLGVSTAGQVNSQTGEIVYATDNIPNYTGINVAERLREAVGLNVSVENDVNSMAIAESWYGAAQDVGNFICIALGTGIGGAAYTDGQLYTGSRFSAGEFGHILLYPNGRTCTCGQYGCYEQYASTLALKRAVSDYYNTDTDLEDFFDRLKAGSQQEQQIYEDWLENVALGLASIIHVINPNRVIIGGAISAQGEFLSSRIQGKLEKKLLHNHKTKLDVVCSRFGNDSNLIGAAKHYLNQYY